MEGEIILAAAGLKFRKCKGSEEMPKRHKKAKVVEGCLIMYEDRQLGISCWRTV